MVGKRRASGRGPGVGFRIVRRRHCVVSFRAGDVGTEVLDPEGQLIGIEALGAASKLGSLTLFDEATPGGAAGSPSACRYLQALRFQ